MGQRYTDQELARMRAKDKRDEHAHARIDELQKVLAQCLSDLAISTDDCARTAKNLSPVKALFAEADKRAERRVGLR